MALLPTSRVTVGGVKVDARTARALAYAEKLAGLPFSYSQGSWSSAVTASGSTHMGSGTVDIRVGSWSNSQRKKVVKALRDSGFAAWLRTPDQGFPYHIHAVLLYCSGLSGGAKWQCDQYLKGKDGLSKSKPDSYAYRPSPQVVFAFYRNRPVPRLAT